MEGKSLCRVLARRSRACAVRDDAAAGAHDVRGLGRRRDDGVDHESEEATHKRIFFTRAMASPSVSDS